MASMNNWLAFSLSPQELPSQPSSVDHHQDHQNGAVSRLGFNSNELSGECFDLTSADSSLPSLNLPPPFGILEAFNRNNHSQVADWNMKGLGMNSDGKYKTSSELSMLMGSSCNTQNQNQNQNLDDQNNQQQQQQQPKLENLLGNHSFSNHQHQHQHQHRVRHSSNKVVHTLYPVPGPGEYMFPNSSLQLPSEPEEDSTSNEADDNNNNNNNINTANGSSSSNIGLSMIKTWLRNQPAPTAAAAALPAEAKNNGGGGGSQSLSLSMSTGSQTGSPLPLLTTSTGGGGGSGGETSSSDNNKHQNTPSGLDIQSAANAIEAVPRKSIDTFGQRTSIYRGVTRHRWTGRYEAHLWDNSCRREGQTRKGRQVYLGGYDKEEKAARAYDLAALKYWGTTTTTNFPISNYENELEEMKHMTRQEYVASLRRKSSGFSRGASIYRGVTRHHQHGRWQARIGRVAGNKDLYLGTFSTQEEAAEAYDIAAIKFRGLNAVTNFDMSRYDVKSILESSTLPIGGAAKRLKEVEQAEMAIDGGGGGARADEEMSSDGTNYNYYHGHGWPTIAFQQQPFSFSNSNSNSMHHHYPNYGQGQGQRVWCKQEQDPDHANHSFQQQDLHHLHQYNFFQPTSVLHNLMAMDSISSSMEHTSSASNSVNIYSNANDQGGVPVPVPVPVGYGIGNNINGGYNVNVIPSLSTVVASDHNNSNQSQGNNGFGDNEVKAIGYESMYGSAHDPYHSRNSYYASQQSSTGGGGVKASNNTYDQPSPCNNWVPTALPTIAQRSSNMGVCHGAPTFTVWSDT